MNQSISSDPLVSVIVPAYNAQSFIASALDSVCRQTYRNIEVLVVDDGSEDGTAEIVRAVATRDDRIRLFLQEHKGVAAARNRAIRESRGDYIAPLDADDIWYPLKLERQVRALRDARPSVGLVYAWSAYLDENGRLNGGYYAHDLPRNLPAALIFRNVVGSSSVPLIRRECFEHAGLYNPDYGARNAQGCEDLDFYLRVAERYQFVVVKEFLVGYRQSRQRMSSHTGAMAKSFYFALRDCMRRRPELPWTVFRWSLARQCLYLHDRARTLGQTGTSIRLLLTALWFDPTFLLKREFYRHLLAGPRRRFSRARIVRGLRPGEGGDEDVGMGATLADISARRARQPSLLFDTLEVLYQRRLHVTERLLGPGTRARYETGRPEVLPDARPRFGEPPA